MHELIKKLKISLEEYQTLLRERDLLEERGESVHAIDRKLDTFDEDLEEKFQAMKKDYLSHHHPHLLEKQKHAALMHENAAHLYLTLYPLYQTLSEGMQIIESAKKRRWFDFLTGRNPKALLAHVLFDAEKMAREAYKKTKTACLKKLIDEVSSPWNQKLYYGKFEQLFAPFAKHLEQAEEQMGLFDLNKKKVEEEIASLF